MSSSSSAVIARRVRRPVTWFVEPDQLTPDLGQTVAELWRSAHLDQSAEPGQLTGHTPHVPARHLELDPSRLGRPADADGVAEHLAKQSHGSGLDRATPAER